MTTQTGRKGPLCKRVLAELRCRVYASTHDTIAGAIMAAKVVVVAVMVMVVVVVIWC